jgi:hypothetical protein
VGDRRRRDQAEVRTHQRERGDQRHSGIADEPPRRPLLAHRGVHRRLPDASPHPRRVRLPVPPGRLSPERAHLSGAERAPRAVRARGSDDGERALLVRHRAPRGDRAPQLPAVPPEPRAAGRDDPRSRRD